MDNETSMLFQITDGGVELMLGNSPNWFLRDACDYGAPYDVIQYYFLGNKPG